MAQISSGAIQGINGAIQENMPAAATEVVGQITKMLRDAYVETDEDIGPRVREFEQTEGQLKLIGEQLTRLRDAASAQHEAHVQLVALAAAEEETSIPSVHAFGAVQEGQASLAQALAAHYDRFVNISVNQLEGLAGVVANKYKAYTGKVVQMRRRKAQLQLLTRQKQLSDLRTLERSLIPSGARSSWSSDVEGCLVKLSGTTRLWWSCYARLNVERKVLLFTSKKDEAPSAASKAVALSRYVLCHELPEHHAGRAAAFELVPLQPDLPVVTLAADGTLASRRWVCALQQAMDHMPEGDGAPSPAVAAGGAAEGAAAAEPPPTPLKTVAAKLGEFYDFATAKTDALDRHFSGTLAEQSQRTELQLSQLGEEKQVNHTQVAEAIDAFSSTMRAQMTDELLRIAEAQLEYHTAMAAQLQQTVVTLRAKQAAVPRPPEPPPQRVAPSEDVAEEHADDTPSPAADEATDDTPPLSAD